MICPKCGEEHKYRYFYFLMDPEPKKRYEVKYCDECGFKLNWDNERQ